jgi:hypothetical protein
MNRDCSWWNAESSNLPEEYVLQHEQIHFALTELEARKLNAKAGELAASFVARGGSEDEVQAEFQKKVNGVLEEALERLLERNRKFDEDTSAKYAPKVQQRWFDEVKRDLAR